MHLQLASWPGLHLADGSREVTGDDGRVRPFRGKECGRCHVLGPRVQRRPDRAVTRIGPRSPGAGKDIVGAPAKQERVGALVDLVHGCAGFIIEVGPSAALEYAALVFIRPAGALHNSVNRDLRGGRQFHGFGSPLAGLIVVKSDLAASILSVEVQAVVQIDDVSLPDGLRYWRWGGRGLCLGAEKIQSQKNT